MYKEQIKNADRQELLDYIEANGFDTTPEDLIKYLEEQGDWIETIEADVLDSLNNGNWAEGAELMRANYLSVYDIIDYIETLEDELGYNAYEFFDLKSVVSLCESVRLINA